MVPCIRSELKPITSKMHPRTPPCGRNFRFKALHPDLELQPQRITRYSGTTKFYGCNQQSRRYHTFQHLCGERELKNPVQLLSTSSHEVDSQHQETPPLALTSRLSATLRRHRPLEYGTSRALETFPAAVAPGLRVAWASLAIGEERHAAPWHDRVRTVG
jgi:hypothetical protein